MVGDGVVADEVGVVMADVSPKRGLRLTGERMGKAVAEERMYVGSVEGVRATSR